MARLKGDASHFRAIFMFYLQRAESISPSSNAFWGTHDRQRKQEPFCFLADLTGAELVDQQGASLRVFPAVEAVQLCGHLVQLLISVVELGQELSVRPLHRNINRGTKKLNLQSKDGCLGQTTQKMQYAEARQ